METATELIKKELKVEKGSGQPDKEKIANISIEQCIKIAKMKKDHMLTRDLKAAVKSIAGSCSSLGILVEGKTGSEIVKEINQGNYDKEIQAEKTDLLPEKKKTLEQQLGEIKEKLAKELAKLKAAEIAEAGPKKEPKAPEPGTAEAGAPEVKAGTPEQKTAEKPKEEKKEVKKEVKKK